MNSIYFCGCHPLFKLNNTNLQYKSRASSWGLSPIKKGWRQSVETCGPGPPDNQILFMILLPALSASSTILSSPALSLQLGWWWMPLERLCCGAWMKRASCTPPLWTAPHCISCRPPMDWWCRISCCPWDRTTSSVRCLRCSNVCNYRVYFIVLYTRG